jgi:hypothetical protein
MTAKQATENVEALVKNQRRFSKNDSDIIDSLKDKDKFTHEEKKLIADLKFRMPWGGGLIPMSDPSLDWDMQQ